MMNMSVAENMFNRSLHPDDMNNVARIIISSFECGNNEYLSKQLSNFTLILGQEMPEYDE